MSLGELLGILSIKLYDETVLDFDTGLGLFIAVPNSVMVSHVSIRPVSMVSKKKIKHLLLKELERDLSNTVFKFPRGMLVELLKYCYVFNKGL